MINKNLLQYAIQTWQSDTYIKPLSEISKSAKGQSLVNKSEKIYWFDGISGEIYSGKNNKPRSVDGLFFTQDTAYFVEFKSGFKKIRTKENFDDKYAQCPKNGAFCQDYKDWFFEKQEKETEELKSSIKFKAIESYITLEKEILPLCEDAPKIKLVLLVVIDEDEIEDYEETLVELSESHAPPKTVIDNSICSLKKSLQGYKKRRDKHDPSNDYYFDEIEVLSPKGFEDVFKKLLPNMTNSSNAEPQTV